MRGRQSDDGVRRSRSNRHASCDRLACDPVMRVRDMGRALLVHDLDKRQFRHRIIERVNQAPVAVPWKAGNIRSSVRFESLADDLTDREPHTPPPGLMLPCRKLYSRTKSVRRKVSCKSAAQGIV